MGGGAERGARHVKFKAWNVAPPCPDGRRALEESGLSPLLAAVLSARGVTDPEDARRLLSPQAEPLLDPMLMRDMDKAAARVRRAVDNGETITVYGDYDVDGITSTCLLTQFLLDLGANVQPYIPGRLEEGYGLNREAVAAQARQGVGLIITVDCGITALDEADYARELGVDLVITDHHACKDRLPRAAAGLRRLLQGLGPRRQDDGLHRRLHAEGLSNVPVKGADSIQSGVASRAADVKVCGSEFLPHASGPANPLDQIQFRGRGVYQRGEGGAGDPRVHLNPAAVQKDLQLPQGGLSLAPPAHRLDVDAVRDLSGRLHHLLHQGVERLGEAAAL